MRLSGGSIRRRLLFVALVPVIAVLPLAVLGAVEDANTLLQARRSANTAENFVEGAEITNALRVEWLTAIDLTAITSNDFDTASSQAFEEFANSVLVDTEQRLDAAIGNTGELIENTSLSMAPFEGRKQALARVEESRIFPAELDLFYETAIREWELSFGFDRLQSSGSLNADVLRAEDVRRSVVTLDADIARLRRELTLAAERLFVSQRPISWDVLGEANESVLRSLALAEDSRSTESEAWSEMYATVVAATEQIDQLVEAAPTPADADVADADSVLGVRQELALSSDLLISVTEEAIDDVIAGTAQVERAATQSLLWTIILFGFGMSIAVFVMAKATKWIAEPLDDAAERARRISNGDLAVKSSLTGSAPLEVQALVDAFDGVADTVQAIESQASAITRGDMDDPALDRRLPGNLGRNLEGTVGRWRETTMRLEHELSHDPVTELASLRHFVRRAEEMQQVEPIAVAVVAFDHFKGVNDTAGRSTGDEVLKVLGQRIDSATPEDGLAARLWSDEFAVLVPSHAFEKLEAAVDTIIEAVREPVVVGGSPWRVSATVGIAEGNEIDGVLNDASLAARHGKGRGGDQVVHHDGEFVDLLDRRAKIEAELLSAISADELETWFQPVFDLRTRAMVGLEALNRWPQPNGEMRSPGEFIPIAEESDLIIELDRWIIRQVCRQLHEWKNTPLAGIHVAVNISARHASRPELVSSIRGACVEFDVDPSLLAVEITETSVVEDAEIVHANLTALRDLGVYIFLDDFGTGYSSLSYIKDLPLDVLKVDRSFISGLDDDDGQSSRLIGAIVMLARGLGMTTVAEGAETEAQIEALEGLGCDFVQGFGLARPTRTTEQLLKILAESSKVQDEAGEAQAA